VERVLGKDEGSGSIPVTGSKGRPDPQPLGRMVVHEGLDHLYGLMGVTPMARRIALRYARTDFKLKQQVNLFVLRQLAEATERNPNDVATEILDSPVHRAIGELAEAMTEEANRLRKQ
jgi:hypothetical protein